LILWWVFSPKMPESGIIFGLFVSALIPAGVWNSAANALMAK